MSALRSLLQRLPRSLRARVRLTWRLWTRGSQRRWAPLVLGVTLATLGLGAGAYAVAAVVVSLAPDPARLPVQQVTAEVQALPFVSPFTAPTPAPLGMSTVSTSPRGEGFRFSVYRSELSRAQDTAEGLLHRLGIHDTQAAAFLKRDMLTHRHLLGRTGRLLSVEASERNTLLKLTARWSPSDDGSFERLIIERTVDGFSSRLEKAMLTASLRMASGVIDSSLFASTDQAGIPDAVAVQLAEIFSADIDFHSDLREGDRYAVVYEMLEGDGEPLRAGRVLSAEFINAGKAYQAVWFTEPNADQPEPLIPGQPTQTTGRSGYYALDGQSLKRAYLASPLAFSRVTSGFRMRFHPILKTWRAHLGVDYAAPIGTPVRAVGDGVVEFAGEQGGYGKVVILRHRNGHQTLYAHLSRILVRHGQRIAQGQTLAASGATGWATGPHLHYEFRINGRHQNPLLIVRRSEAAPPVSAANRPAFDQVALQARQQLGAAQLLASR
ncbi:M23 family metallopeptidase [Hylemonella sp. W303a]|uniref:M23 family metallopeptidase n=1 Tax=Hylemonella sp. W303a TaxID=3389873 RepID=UPI00396AF3C0